MFAVADVELYWSVLTVKFAGNGSRGSRNRRTTPNAEAKTRL